MLLGRVFALAFWVPPFPSHRHHECFLSLFSLVVGQTLRVKNVLLDTYLMVKDIHFCFVQDVLIHRQVPVVVCTKASRSQLQSKMMKQAVVLLALCTFSWLAEGTRQPTVKTPSLKVREDATGLSSHH